jgi:dolichol kinase
MPVHVIEEIKRKLFHMLTLIYVVGYWFLPREIAVGGMGITIFTALVIEMVRLNHKKINRLILLLGIHRKSEEQHLSGLLWTLSGAFFTMYFFDSPANPLTRNIVLAALLYAALGDTAAALVGRLIGRTRIGTKSLEGSLACLLTNLAVGYFLLPWPIFLWGALFSAFFELIKWPLNDNFWIPILSAGALTQLMIRYSFL